jgi:exonuclease VII small subunit
MLSFALDQKISITSSVRNSNTTTRASVEKATLVIENMQRQIHSFNIKSNHASDQNVVVEVPSFVGYSLLAPTGKALGEAQGRQRVSLPAPAGSARSHEVTLELATPQRLPLQNLSAYQLQEYVRVAKDEASAAMLRRLLALRQGIETQQEALAQANTQLNEQQAEQLRLRESLTTVSRGSELHKRYSTSLNDAENQIVASLKARDAATLARIKLEAELKQMLVF